MYKIIYKFITKKQNLTIIFSGVFCCFLPFPANAYLDPGMGSLILQALIGGLAAAGAFASLYFQKIKTIFREAFSRSKRTEKQKIDE